MNWPFIIVYNLGIILIFMAMSELLRDAHGLMHSPNHIDRRVSFFIGLFWPVVVVGIVLYGLVEVVRRKA